LLELDNIGLAETPMDVLRETISVYAQYDWHHAPFILFTGVSKRGKKDHSGTAREDNYGKALADFIVEKGLGSVVASEERRNGATVHHNYITVWVWTVDWPAVRTLFPNANREWSEQFDSKNPGTYYRQFVVDRNAVEPVEKPLEELNPAFEVGPPQEAPVYMINEGSPGGFGHLTPQLVEWGPDGTLTIVASDTNSIER
jgi:hypothetical protein